MDGPGTRKKAKKTPQELIAAFWGRFHSKYPGKVTSIFPRSLYSNVLPLVNPRGAHSARNAAESYETAARECRQRVARIVRECGRTNEKYTDADYDIEHDPEDNCLYGLVCDGAGSGNTEAGSDTPPVSAWDVKQSLNTLAQSRMLGMHGTMPVDVNALNRFVGSDSCYAWDAGGSDSGEDYRRPGSFHRVDWIFESPQFTVNGYSSSDIKQGGNGDCWWLAAVATIAHRKDLMERVCVARDEECGVYGFVFQRDGEWVSVVVDDNLYLRKADFGHHGSVYDSTGRKARQYRKRYQTGSEALYFARCEDPNETWLPLLEKAYAKAHGDYEAISGGHPGQGVEDMTGGVTTTITSSRVLSREKLWHELENTNSEFVFALAVFGTSWDGQKSGLALDHAYSILKCREVSDEEGNTVRLVQIRNPWGERSPSGVGEWNGPWSDGSKEWTPYWLKKLGHTFGDDGIFWMSYKDMLETFKFIYRTRLFDEKWTVVQQWTSANVSWITGYLQTKFEITVAKDGVVVIVLTQLDDRYFRGFEGEYLFELHFLLQEVGAASGEHICRVRPVDRWEDRSVSCEVELEAGKKYEVLPKITATRNGGAKPPQDIVKEYAEKNPQKLRQVGMSYDLAHAKGGVPDEDEILEKKKAELKKKKDDEKRKRQKKRRKATTKAAKAMEKAADAMKEAIQGDKEEEKKAEGTTRTSSAKDKNSSSNGKLSDAKATPATSPKPEAPGSSNPPAPAAAAGVKDAPPSPVEEEKKADSDNEASAEKEKEAVTVAEEKEAEIHNEEGKDKDDASDDSDTEDQDDDDDYDDYYDDEGSITSPWNAVAVVGLRVYAQDPEVTVKLVQATGADEVTTLTVDGKPAGATM